MIGLRVDGRVGFGSSEARGPASASTVDIGGTMAGRTLGSGSRALAGWRPGIGEPEVGILRTARLWVSGMGWSAGSIGSRRRSRDGYRWINGLREVRIQPARYIWISGCWWLAGSRDPADALLMGVELQVVRRKLGSRRRYRHGCRRLNGLREVLGSGQQASIG
jgi:hypothetical protein